MEERQPRKLAVILHADVVGSTMLVHKNESIAHARILDTFRRLSLTIETYGGVTHELRGDALVAEFFRASDAASAALIFQRENAEANSQFDDDLQPWVRIGISLGEVVIADNTVTGAGVVLAQRVEQMAEPGGVCITGAIREAAPQHLPFEYFDLGKREAKGFEEPVQVYGASVRTGAQVPSPELVVSPNPKSSKSKHVLASSTVTLLVLVGGALAWWQPWKNADHAIQQSPPLPERPSIAVLPFDNLGANPEEEYFADGLTDDLITDLSKVSGLLVIARNSVFAFKNKAVPADDIAREFGVRYVIEGSVRRSGNRIRVNAQLIESATSHHLWAERYDREITDLFGVQDELVGQIVAALAVRLTQSEQATLTHRPVPNLEAYELYLKARDGYFSRDHARMRESFDLYVQATRIDPSFARAQSGLAQLAADLWRLGSVRGLASGVSKKLAETAAQKAIDLDPTLSDPHSVLALLRLTEAKHDYATVYARRAIELDPNNADAHTTLSIVLGYAGHHALALEAIRTAVRLDPRPPPFLSSQYGWSLFFNGRHEDAIAVLEPIASTRDRALADSPREILAMAYAESGVLDKARDMVKSIVDQETFVSLSWYRAIYNYHARVDDLERRLSALRKAGMPEWPLDFQGDPTQRVSGSALESLILGRTWSGTDVGRRAEFIQEFMSNGDVVYAGQDSLLSGKVLIKGNELCEQFVGFSRGIAFCGSVFRNTKGTPEQRNEYFYVNPLTLRHFSVAP